VVVVDTGGGGEMLRQEKLIQIAEQLMSLVADQGDVECYEVPNNPHALEIHGKVDLLVLAEWVLARMG
jgi:hypothetical protein